MAAKITETMSTSEMLRREQMLQAAERLGQYWRGWPQDGRIKFREHYPTIAPMLDELVVFCKDLPLATDHQVRVFPVSERGRAENGYQPEREWVWACSCRPNRYSGDMMHANAAKEAVAEHLVDPTQFSGWVE